MMIGPDPMIRILRMSSRLGMAPSRVGSSWTDGWSGRIFSPGSKPHAGPFAKRRNVITRRVISLQGRRGERL